MGDSEELSDCSPLLLLPTPSPPLSLSVLLDSVESKLVEQPDGLPTAETHLKFLEKLLWRRLTLTIPLKKEKKETLFSQAVLKKLQDELKVRNRIPLQLRKGYLI